MSSSSTSLHWREELAKGNTLELTGPGGSALAVAQHGAHAYRWKTSTGEEWLFLSPLAEFGGSKSIRGGIPVVFPQFAELGPLPKHGLLRDKPWTLVTATQPDDGDATAHLSIADDEATRRLWPHAFRADLVFELGAEHLKATLSITNTDSVPFHFTTALHNYLRVDDVADIRIKGLKGLSYQDKAAGGVVATEVEDRIAIIGEVDRVYASAPAHRELIDRHRRLHIECTGFVDAVVWNPGAAKAAGLKDLDDGGWHHFVCIESAVISQPIELAAGQSWQASQKFASG